MRVTDPVEAVAGAEEAERRNANRPRNQPHINATTAVTIIKARRAAFGVVASVIKALS